MNSLPLLLLVSMTRRVRRVRWVVLFGMLMNIVKRLLMRTRLCYGDLGGLGTEASGAVTTWPS